MEPEANAINRRFRLRDLYTSSRGMGMLGYLLLILLVVAAVFVGMQVIPFYYSYFEVRGLMEAQAAKAVDFSDDQIRGELLRMIKKQGIPIDKDEDLKINRFNGRIAIDLEYSELLYVTLPNGDAYDLWEFKFHPHAEHYL